MEEALLLKNDELKLLPTSDSFVEELKKVSNIAAPMVVVTVSQYLLRVAPMIMVGHLSALPLSSVAISTSLTNVTGYSLLVKFIAFQLKLELQFTKIIFPSYRILRTLASIPSP